MQELKLPIINGVPAPPRHLSMDNYLKFVNFCFKYFLDKKAIRKQKRLEAVNVKFIL